jgi:hypothetical protein
MTSPSRQRPNAFSAGYGDCVIFFINLLDQKGNPQVIVAKHQVMSNLYDL